MKDCTKCKLPKADEEFNFKNSKKETLRSECKECQAKVRRRSYERNRDKEISLSKKMVKQTKFRNRKFIFDYLSSHPCKCGESNPILLEFDHREPEKKSYSVSSMVTHGLSRIKEEIEKCDVLCVRCHRLKTAEQFGWYKDFT